MSKLGNRRDDTMQFRLSPEEKILIQLAAKRKRVLDSVYARQSAIRQAEIDLADKTDYGVSEEKMNAFLSALDEPAIVKPKLKELLESKTILE